VIGALSEEIGPPAAILVMAGIGVAGLGLIARRVLGPVSQQIASPIGKFPAEAEIALDRHLVGPHPKKDA
jgi:hypothetical protein